MNKTMKALLLFFFIGMKSAHEATIVSKIKYHDIPFLNQLIWVESKNNPKARSKKGAVGLMQITKPVLDDYYTFAGIKYTMGDMTNSQINIEVGTWQLRRLKKYYQCEVKTVSAYNMGIGHTDEGIINFAYTFAILGTNKVMAWLGDRPVKSWKGTKTCYIVEGL